MSVVTYASARLSSAWNQVNAAPSRFLSGVCKVYGQTSATSSCPTNRSARRPAWSRPECLNRFSPCRDVGRNVERMNRYEVEKCRAERNRRATGCAREIAHCQELVSSRQADACANLDRARACNAASLISRAQQQRSARTVPISQ